MMSISNIDRNSAKGNLLPLPLRWLRPDMVVPVLSGRLIGKRWIVGAGPHQCWLGSYEREIQERFAMTVQRKSIVFDVGGQAGFYTLLASRLVGRQGKVYVFEPLPRNLEYLEKHIQLNKARNVTVIEAALSYKNGFAYFDASPDGEKSQLTASGQQRVWTCTLDTLLELGQIPAPDLIRMDIGGGEFAALTGAKALLAKAHPVLFLTTHGQAAQRECCAFLELLGYRLSPIDGKPLEASSEILASQF